jgi:hypothetical protein
MRKRKSSWKRSLKRAVIFVAVVLGLAIAYQESRYYPQYSFTAKSFSDLHKQVHAWQAIELGTMTDQDVTSYTQNLNSKIKLLETQIAAMNAYQAMQDTPKPTLWFQPVLALELSPLVIPDLENIGIPAENLMRPGLEAHLGEVMDGLNQVRRRYYLDKAFIRYSAADWLIMHGNPQFKESVALATKLFAQVHYVLNAEKQKVHIFADGVAANADSQNDNEVQAPESSSANSTPLEPVFVRAGDVIGIQGCTGLCSGTHLHFVAYVNGALSDACNFLPRREFVRWGTAASCGVDPETASLSWPLPFAWIISQRFDEFSPLVNDTHGALDLIDRWWGPVVAAHDGYLYTQKRSCRFAAICNDGYANVVTICTEKDCNASQLKTEYWHLDWMLGDEIRYKSEPQ